MNNSKIVDGPDDGPGIIQPEQIKKHLKTKFIGQELFCYNEVSSTNDCCQELIRWHQSPSGTIVVAAKQTKGKGRRGRRWVSPEGGLWFSLLLKPPLPLKQMAFLSLVWAVAVCKALARFVPSALRLDCCIKWPNDVLIGDRKVAGILLETTAAEDGGNYVITGIGININNSSEQYPLELRRQIIALSEISQARVDINQVLLEVLSALEHYYTIYIEQGALPIITEVTRHCYHIGSQISVTLGDSRVTGINTGLDYDGSLIIDDGIELIKMTTGDVKVLGD